MGNGDTHLKFAVGAVGAGGESVSGLLCGNLQNASVFGMAGRSREMIKRISSQPVLHPFTVEWMAANPWRDWQLRFQLGCLVRNRKGDRNMV